MKKIFFKSQIVIPNAQVLWIILSYSVVEKELKDKHKNDSYEWYGQFSSDVLLMMFLEQPKS